jgi:hypothetical protein
MQQLILGTGTAIWWLTEPHCYAVYRYAECHGVFTLSFKVNHNKLIIVLPNADP